MRDHYHGQAAKRYDTIWRTFTRLMLTPVVEEALAHLPPQARVLDVGCGTGVLLAQLLARQPDLRLWGTDASTAMLAQARARLAERAQLVTWDLEHPAPLAIQEAGRFDLITCTNVAHYLHAPSPTITRLAQLLHASGCLILADFTTHGWWWPLFEGILYLADRQHRRTLSPNSLFQLASDAGLHVRQLPIVSAGIPWQGTIVVGTLAPHDAHQ